MKFQNPILNLRRFSGFQVPINRKAGESRGKNLEKSNEKVGIIGVKM